MNKFFKLIKNQIINQIKIVSLKKKKEKDGYYYAKVQGSKMAFDLDDGGLYRELGLSGAQKPDYTLIKSNSVKEVLKRAITSGQFFKTIWTSIKETRIEKEYNNIENLMNNSYLYSRTIQVFFELNEEKIH